MSNDVMMLMQDAIKEEVRERKSKWKELSPIVLELRDNKNFTFQQIAEWFETKGIKASTPNVYQTYNKYKEDNDG